VFKEAKYREAIKKRIKREQELKKAKIKDLKHANKLYNNKIAEEKYIKVVREKEERNRMRAEE
jgi:hypothetical protein